MLLKVFLPEKAYQREVSVDLSKIKYEAVVQFDDRG